MLVMVIRSLERQESNIGTWDGAAAAFLCGSFRRWGWPWRRWPHQSEQWTANAQCFKSCMRV